VKSGDVGDRTVNGWKGAMVGCQLPTLEGYLVEDICDWDKEGRHGSGFYIHPLEAPVFFAPFAFLAPWTGWLRAEISGLENE
jgi:hypothetical protein